MTRSPDTLPASLADPLATLDLIWRAERKSPKTRRTYTEAAVWLAQRLPTDSVRGWSDVTKDDVREHLAWLSENHSPAYCSNQFRALQQAWKKLSIELEIPDPMAGMTPPSVPVKVTKIVTNIDLDRLLATCQGKRWEDLRDTAIIRMFASSGCRLAEIAGLRISDVDVVQTSMIVTGKAEKQRIARFSPQAAVAVQRYIRARNAALLPQTPMLWVGKQGPMTASGIYQALCRRCEKAGIKIHPHQFRHAFAHNWLAAGGSESDLMVLAGWDSPAMPRYYGASLRVERASAAYDRLYA